LCPTVAIADNLLAGQDCDYCSNFCDGKFVGCCDRFGNCGGNPCAAGELEISGCKEIFTDAPTNSPDAGNGNGSGSSMVFLSRFAVLTIMASSLMLAKQMN
jgi:hypothetical protein